MTNQCGLLTRSTALIFWGEKGGYVKTLAFEHEGKMFDENDAFRADTGKTVLTDQTVYRIGAGEASRWIDCTITFRASHGDVQFHDTKEGLFAIRTHPDLRLSAKPKAGVHEVFGSAVNSEGETGEGIWGKPAKWVLYQGPIEGKPMSIAIYDHSTNLRHPTTWHARDYGLVTANPFGLHHFLGKEKGEGAYVVKNEESLTLRYRVEFIQGIARCGGRHRKPVPDIRRRRKSSELINLVSSSQLICYFRNRNAALRLLSITGQKNWKFEHAVCLTET